MSLVTRLAAQLLRAPVRTSAQPAPKPLRRRRAHGAQGEPAPGRGHAPLETLPAAAPREAPPSAGGGFQVSDSPPTPAPARTLLPGAPKPRVSSDTPAPSGWSRQCQARNADDGRRCGLLEGHDRIDVAADAAVIAACRPSDRDLKTLELARAKWHRSERGPFTRCLLAGVEPARSAELGWHASRRTGSTTD